MPHKPKGIVAKIDPVNDIYRSEAHCGRRKCPESKGFVQDGTMEAWLVGWGEKYYSHGLSEAALRARTQNDADKMAEEIGNHCRECRRS